MGLKFHPELDDFVSWPVLVFAGVFYLLSIVVLKEFMQSREKYTLAGFMRLYNAAQVVLCAYMIYGFARESFAFPNVFGINSDFTAGTEWFVFVHYASKYLDFFDTWIMILKKNYRQLSFLHVYHHASILLVWGGLLNLGQGNGTAYFGAAINSVIHLIMYSHYLYTSFGLVNPFKKFITQAQLIQFGLCLLHAVLAVAFEEKLNARLAWVQFAYHISMLVLFLNFYEKTYKAPAGAGKPAKADATAAPAAEVTAAAEATPTATRRTLAGWVGRAGRPRADGDGCAAWGGFPSRHPRDPHEQGGLGRRGGRHSAGRMFPHPSRPQPSA